MKILCTGSSSVNIFECLKNKNCDVIKFKGVSIKSLLNKTEHYYNLQKLLEKNYNIIILVFGEVDLNFYYYYKKYFQKDINFNDTGFFKSPELYIKMIQELIQELIQDKTPKVYILNIPADQVPTELFNLKLLTYMKIDNKEDYIKDIPEFESYIETRYTRIDKFNKLLKEECEKSNFTFIDFNKYILNQFQVHKLFRLDFSQHNVHLFFEHVCLVILYKTELKLLLNYYDIDDLKIIMKNNADYWKKSFIYNVQTKINDPEYTNVEKKKILKKKLIKIQPFSFEFEKVMKYIKKISKN